MPGFAVAGHRCAGIARMPATLLNCGAGPEILRDRRIGRH
jgi:hypothetical protein